MHLQQPDGTTPRIGGADDGKPLRMEHRPLWDFRFAQAIGAALFRRGDFKAAAGPFAEDALWLLGDTGRVAFENLRSSLPPTSVSLRASGYYVLRSASGPDADYVCFDCGPQADGLRRDDVPSAAHGHADCLSTIVWLSGRPVLVDAGVFAYNGSKPWVEHFRRTGSHNTLLVDGRDQAEYCGRMDWARTYAARFECFEQSERGWRVTGSHDGFTRLDPELFHRRTVHLRHGHYVVICDEIFCSRPHEIELVFQFAPGTARIQDHIVTFDDVELGWTSSELLQPTLTCGGAQANEGWIAESLGVRVPAPRLSLRGSVTAPGSVILTVISDMRVMAGAGRLRPRTGAIDVALPALSRGLPRYHERIAARGLTPQPWNSRDPVTISELRVAADHLALVSSHDSRSR
jgi:hypothetical protein